MINQLSKKIAWLAMLAVACLAQLARADDFAIKEQEIVAASNDTIAALSKLRQADTLNSTTARKIIDMHIALQFNFQLLAQQALGKHWQKANEAQRDEVSDLFGSLLKKTYANALAKFSDQTLVHKPGTRTDNQGTVLIAVSNKGKQITVEYTLTKAANGVWDITDLKVKRVSLLGNYRRQFSSIVRKSGIDGLISLLKQKA